MRPRVPHHVETLRPYVPGKPLEEVERELGLGGLLKLSDNENPLGPSPLALAAMEEAIRKVHLYPDPSSFYLVRALAQRLAVSPEQVIAGSGSNELIELVIRTLMTPEDEALVSAGSFLMYKVALHAHGRPYVEVPMGPGFRYDLPAIAARISAKTRVIFLSNPDNPTGTAFSRAELEAFLPRVPPDVYVVLDEAYFEFARGWAEAPDGLCYLRQYPNLIVLRTFAKAYGLAGVRLGYGVMAPDLVGYLHRTRMPFHVTSVAQAAGCAALGDVDHVQRTVALARTGVAFLASKLRQLGAEVPDSHTNFVFAHFSGPARPIHDGLRARGILTRSLEGYGLPNALRISTGLPAHHERLLQALREVL